MTLHFSMPSDASSVTALYADEWTSADVLERFWSKDPTVWADPPIPETSDRLGWLDAPTTSRSLIGTIDALHTQAVSEGITDIVLCGMGGSSLAPEVFAATLPGNIDSPALTVIDSTHPRAVDAVARATDPETTWYIVASKSGGTIETMSLFRYFWMRADELLEDPGSHFIAITDPGTSLGVLAADRGFRSTVLADPNIGGRYSALTAFGLVPAGLIGADIAALLDSADRAASLCRPGAPLAKNPGFTLGALLAERARQGTDKAQFVGSRPATTIGIWTEQLIAESTGKEGKGIVPIDGGPALPDATDATVVAVGGTSGPEADIAVRFDDPYDIAGAMFILEFATAVAGRCLGINPFDQPDVQLAKKLATAAMKGDLGPDKAPPIPLGDLEWIDDLMESLRNSPPSYVSVQAYVPRTPETAMLLDDLRQTLTAASNAYVTIGFGPRFLHSTGQLHKGGPEGGVYLQIIDDTGEAMEIPGTDSTFNELIAAQAMGDRAALVDRGRSVTAVILGTDTNSGLSMITERIRERAED
jgi:transaldolase/glucose-6-phosphate isomerase